MLCLEEYVVTTLMVIFTINKKLLLGHGHYIEHENVLYARSNGDKYYIRQDRATVVLLVLSFRLNLDLAYRHNMSYYNKSTKRESMPLNSYVHPP